jgi:hypothetical protein
MEHLSQTADNSIKCDSCGSNNTRSRVIWLDPMDGQIYPKVKLPELVIFLGLMGLSLVWFIITVIYNLNPFLMILSVVLLITFISVNVIQIQRYLSRKKFEETWFYNCKNCGNQWMAPYDPDSKSPD